MGAPDPDGISIDLQDGRVVVQFQVWCESNPVAREARAVRILRLIGIDGDNWQCRWCGNPIPVFKRADAHYCRETCRKANARARRRRD